jgi:hypothetical protein
MKIVSAGRKFQQLSLSQMEMNPTGPAGKEVPMITLIHRELGDGQVAEDD